MTYVMARLGAAKKVEENENVSLPFVRLKRQSYETRVLFLGDSHASGLAREGDLSLPSMKMWSDNSGFPREIAA